VVDEKDEEHQGETLHHLFGTDFSLSKQGYGSE